jgi:hypothetical protein
MNSIQAPQRRTPTLQNFPAVEVQRQDLPFHRQRVGDANLDVYKSEIFSLS